MAYAMKMVKRVLVGSSFLNIFAFYQGFMGMLSEKVNFPFINLHIGFCLL